MKRRLIMNMVEVQETLRTNKNKTKQNKTTMTACMKKHLTTTSMMYKTYWGLLKIVISDEINQSLRRQGRSSAPVGNSNEKPALGSCIRQAPHCTGIGSMNSPLPPTRKVAWQTSQSRKV
jgi:hypothetical protein